MSVFSVFGLVLVLLYGGSSLIGSLLQLKSKVIPYWSSISFCLISALMIIFTCFFFSYPFLLFEIIVTLLLMHILAIFNGLYMYKKIHVLHHFIRFIISLLIVYLLII